MMEFFETFEEDGAPAGQVERAVVHRLGLWHRAVHVWVFRPDGCVYVQRRAPDKDVCPNCWDVSVGEHLQPGEGWLEAARRGLREELGIVDAVLQPVGRERRLRNHMPAVGVDDREIQRLFATTHAGPVRPEPAEIAELVAWEPETLGSAVDREPSRFTPGLRADIAALSVVGPDSDVSVDSAE